MKKVLSVMIAVLLMFSLTACGGETIVWENIALGYLLPEPPESKGDVHTNAADELWISINDLDSKQYNDYVEACKEMGFTIDAESNSSSYQAYNAEGYELSLSHYGSDADMSIRLEAPMELTTISWPTGTAGQQLPAPNSTTGKFTYEYDDNFFVYIGKTSRSDYAEYVNACSEIGFNVDYSKGEDYYYADNAEGWHISLRYEGNNIMSIDIDAPKGTESNNDVTEPPADDSEQTPEPDTENEETEGNNNSTAIDPDFKAAMDSYEKFMDEYVAFMKKYSANPTDMSLLAKYSEFMSDYADFVEDFEKWEDEDLNDAELAYYLEVQARVTKKLADMY